MVSSEGFYPGANYGLDPWYAEDVWDSYGMSAEKPAGGYGMSTARIGFPSDPTTSNQIRAVTEKLNTGAKVVEVSGVNIMGRGGALGQLDAIPKQQFDEIRRLKDLTGVELTFHGPLVEASGIGSRGEPFEELNRQQAEREMWHTMQKAHQLDNKKGIPVVFHSSTLGAPLQTTFKDEKTGEEITTDRLYVDKHTGSLKRVGLSQFHPDYFKGAKAPSIDEGIRIENQEKWEQSLASLSFSAFQARDILDRALDQIGKKGGTEEDKQAYLDYYKEYLQNPEKAQKMLKDLGPSSKGVEENIKEILHGEAYLRGQYKNLKDMYNQAYSTSTGKDKELLDDYRKRIAPKIESYETDPSKAPELAEVIIDGINTLRKVQAPSTVEPLRDFMIEKSSETISNVALKSFKEYKDAAPIIAIENPPVSTFALSRAEELVDLVKQSRDKFIEKATLSKNEGGMGLEKSEAKKQADKLIGLTWDTAHINTLRAKGYSEKDILKEVKKAAPYVKHIHISDNFGMEDTELPPGWGTAPINQSIELIEGYNKQVKKIVETGDWFSRMGMGKKTPILESFSGLGASVYAASRPPYWAQSAYTMGSYFGGLGEINPQIHHSIYGGGFSGMPAELGGQFGGGRSNLSGTPIE